MREIKFRAWGPYCGWDEEGEPVYGYTYDLAFDEYAPINDLLAGVECLEQYTGLKDKNGREIYEGDIVATELGYDYAVDNFLVSYCGGYWFPLVQVEQGYNCIDRYRPEDFEILGNIHENADLLR